MRCTALVLAAVLLAACTSTPAPSRTTQPTETPSALGPPADPHPEWPDIVVLAMPPGTGVEQYADGLRYWNRQLKNVATANDEHPVTVEPYEPADMADTVQALADGRVNLAVLDAYWVVEAQRLAEVQVRQLALVDDRQQIVGGWISRDVSLCNDSPLAGVVVTSCNGASEATASAGSTGLEQLGSLRIALGEPTSALEYVLPARQLTLSGVDLRTVTTVTSASDRLTALCLDEADVTVVPLPLIELPERCAGQDPVLFATTAAVPTSAIVTAGLPDQMAEQIALQLAGQAGCEVQFDPSPCSPFWVPLWGEVMLSQANSPPDYASLIEALYGSRGT